MMGAASQPAVGLTGSYKIISKALAMPVPLPQQVAIAQSRASVVSFDLYMVGVVSLPSLVERHVV